MFEKEAEDNKPPYAYCSLVTDCKLWKDGFQKGAEFGYNKGYHDAEKHYLNVIDNQHKLVDESKKKDFRKCMKCTDGTYQYGFKDGYNKAKEELEKDNNRLFLEGAKRVEELEAQIEKLIDFVLSKIECCDVCPITDTCINSEGTCPYAGILANGEEEVTREWIMQFISKEIKEND